MADTLREVAQEAVARVEGAPVPTSRTGHGEQVATALKAEADIDVFTALQIAAGEQVSPAILRTNLNVSIGILRASGAVERPAGSDYLARHGRGEAAIANAESYFSDRSFAEFKGSPEGPVVIESTGRFLMSHPALSEYFTNIADPADKLNAAKALAEKFLQDPFAREKVRQALLDSAINKGEVTDEYSEVDRKRIALEAKILELQAKQTRLEGVPPALGEIGTLKAKRREFDRFSDDARTAAGVEFTALQTSRGQLAVIESDIRGVDGDITAARTAIQSLRTEMAALQQGRRNAAFAPVRDESVVAGDIAAKEGFIVTKMSEKNGHEVLKAAKQAEIDAIEAEKKQMEEDIKKKEEELKETKLNATIAKNERDEQLLKLAKMEAAKARSEEMAVSELENVFKKGVEQELMERLNKAKDAADKAMGESADKATETDEKKYLELRAKRHKTPEGKIDGKAINEDFSDMKRDSSEYRVVRRRGNPNRVFLTERPRAGWSKRVPKNEIFYLTGPEFAMVRMMSKTEEFGGDFIMSKLKDAEWMKTQSEDFAAQVLREKMYASRGWLKRTRTGVKRLTSSEIVKIKNSTWGSSILEQSLEASKEHAKEIDAALGGELLSGPGSWREKIGKMSNKKLALLIAVLATSGALLLPQVTLAGLTSAGSAIYNIPGAISTGAVAGAATGLAIGHSGRSRTS